MRPEAPRWGWPTVAVSTLATGYIVTGLGQAAGYLAITAAALAATGLIWVFVSETKPEKYAD